MKTIFASTLIALALLCTTGCATRMYTNALTASSHEERIAAVDHAVDLDDRIAIYYAITDESWHRPGDPEKTVHSASLRYTEWLADLECNLQPLDKDIEKLEAEGTPVKIIRERYPGNADSLPEIKARFRKTNLSIALYYSDESFSVVRRAPSDNTRILGHACHDIARSDYTPGWQVLAGAPLYPILIAVDIVSSPFQLLFYYAAAPRWPS